MAEARSGLRHDTAMCSTLSGKPPSPLAWSTESLSSRIRREAKRTSATGSVALNISVALLEVPEAPRCAHHDVHTLGEIPLVLPHVRAPAVAPHPQPCCPRVERRLRRHLGCQLPRGQHHQHRGHRRAAAVLRGLPRGDHLGDEGEEERERLAVPGSGPCEHVHSGGCGVKDRGLHGLELRDAVRAEAQLDLLRHREVLEARRPHRGPGRLGF
mmetsp:Transcript_26954/g.86602  ORF Transcript_26954/g.86602 Transcript_26954/m.86602 type:complete len:213 (+) Transcript_26954:425-1063(+)